MSDPDHQSGALLLGQPEHGRRLHPGRGPEALPVERGERQHVREIQGRADHAAHQGKKNAIRTKHQPRSPLFVVVDSVSACFVYAPDSFDTRKYIAAVLPSRMWSLIEFWMSR